MTEHETPAESASASPAVQAALPFGDTPDAEESPAVEAPTLAELLATVRHFGKRIDETRSQEHGRMSADIAAISQNVAAIAERTEEMRPLLERQRAEGAGGKDAVEAAKHLDKRIGVFTADFNRGAEAEWKGRRRWQTVAMAVAFPAFLLLGILVEQQFQIVPINDSTGGWRDYVWDNYGRSIVDCAREAVRTDAEVDCAFVVRKP